MFTSTTQEITSNFSGLNAGNANNYFIYYCVDGKCKPTSGYIKNNGVVIGFKDNSFGNEFTDVAAGVNEESGCNDDNIGKLFKNKSAVCIKHKIGMTFAENPIDYLIMEGTAAKGTVFESEENGYIIKNGEGYIIKDAFMNEGESDNYLLYIPY